ncbi:MAG: TRAP transporter small permease subunit [Woeseia sp.]
MTDKAQKTAAECIDRASEMTGRAVSWLTLLMVLVTLVIVVLRYVFDEGYIWLQESLTWMHALVFMLGAGYTLKWEEHVRVDVFYRDMSERRQAIVNAAGVILFLLPLCLFMAYISFDYAARAWALREISRDAGGLPYPAVPLLKSVLLLMPLVVGLQGTALLLRSLRTLKQD